MSISLNYIKGREEYYLMKMAFFECEGWEKEYLEKKFPYLFKLYEIDFYESDISHHISELSTYDVISVFIYSKVDKSVIDALNRCKCIITRSMGYDHIDVEYANSKGIRVYNIYDYGTNTVAEFTVMLILALLRKMKKVFYDYEIREIIDPKAFRGYELQNRTVGIVGTGNIGTRVIELLQGFDVKILAYSRREREELKKKYGVKYVSFEDLLKKSDIISFHVPLTSETRHMLNVNNVKLLKGAYIINTARGQVIETEAIIKGLKDGNIKGIALDVFEGEKLEHIEVDALFKLPSPEEIREAFAHQILRHSDNVIITPHIAYDTEEALQRILSTTVNIAVSLKNNTLEEVSQYEVKAK